MAPPNPVKIVEVCRVAPPPTSPDSATLTTSLPLTFFDIFWLRYPPNQRLFFYESSLPTTKFSETLLPKLKQSLSFTLQHYLPLAGNLTWHPDFDKPILQYLKGNTVSLTVAKSEADFQHLSSHEFRKSKELRSLVPNLPSSDTQVPLMAFQITLFPNNGYSIGYAIHHVAADGKTIAMFMSSWAFICRSQGTLLPDELTPSYNRTLINNPDDRETAYLKAWLKQNGPDNNRSLRIWDFESSPDSMLGTFQLTHQDMENIKKSVLKRRQDFHISTFTITSAYLWVCSIKSRKINHEKVRLVISVDCRGRLDPPLPPTYFGNCIAACFADAHSRDLVGEDGVAVATKAIGEAIEGLRNGFLPRGAKDSITSLLCADKGTAATGVLAVAGSHRFEHYSGTDFGWGRPRKVELISNDKTGALALSDCRDGDGGIEIGVVLKKDEVEAFASMFASGLDPCSNSS